MENKFYEQLTNLLKNIDYEIKCYDATGFETEALHTIRIQVQRILDDAYEGERA